MSHKRAIVVVAMLAALGLAPAAQAQPSVLDYRWSFDVGLGWDNSLSGNINSGAIGRLNDRFGARLPRFAGSALVIGSLLLPAVWPGLPALSTGLRLPAA